MRIKREMGFQEELSEKLLQATNLFFAKDYGRFVRDLMCYVESYQ